VDLQNTTLQSAIALSADGRTIVGTGFQNDVSGSGPVLWVATIPEPSTAVLMGLGLGLLSRQRQVKKHRA